MRAEVKINPLVLTVLFRALGGGSTRATTSPAAQPTESALGNGAAGVRRCAHVNTSPECSALPGISRCGQRLYRDGSQ
jgi:hypothetical protein